jgi:putative ABC transport system permease protein
MRIPLSYNLRNLHVRRASTAASAAGIALVVAVFVLVLSLAQGFAWALRTAGSPENAIVLRKGSVAELTSGILRETAASIAVRPEIAEGPDGSPAVVREVVVLAVLPRRGDGSPSQVLIRGTQEAALAVRPQVRLIEGRMFRPGLPELIVGRSLSRRMEGLDLGGSIGLKGRRWTVVGVFETGRSGFESEVWADCDVLQSAFNRESVYQSITFRMAEPQKFEALRTAIEGDPRYQAKVLTEARYYEEQAGTLSTFIEILGTLITVIMSVGAVFGAMNTMYAAVGSRAREIAMLRSLGFTRRAVLASFLIESLILSAIGGILGCLLALPLNGLSTGTINWDTFSELAFAFRITPGTFARGILFALIMGAVGGLFPALRAARLPVVTGLRQV